jgi:hypothetical protein
VLRIRRRSRSSHLRHRAASRDWMKSKKELRAAVTEHFRVSSVDSKLSTILEYGYGWRQDGG